LEEFVTLAVNATIKDGISRQVEAFKSGFSEVCSTVAVNRFLKLTV